MGHNFGTSGAPGSLPWEPSADSGAGHRVPRELGYQRTEHWAPLGPRLGSQELGMGASRAWSGFTRTGHGDLQGLELRALKMLGLGSLRFCHRVLKGLQSPRARHEGPPGLEMKVSKGFQRMGSLRIMYGDPQ